MTQYATLDRGGNGRSGSNPLLLLYHDGKERQGVEQWICRKAMMGTQRILIMEDVSQIRQFIVDMLSQINGVPLFLLAEDAGAAAKLIKEEKPTIAVLDISVPSSADLANGIDVLKFAKAVHPAMRVIMLTNHANERYRLACQQAGADFFLDKSTEFDLLLQAVQSLTTENEGRA